MVNGDMTLYNILNMRSGLWDYSHNPEWLSVFDENPGRVWLPDELAAYSNTFWRNPGTDYNYSNSNFVMLGMMIEKITGKSYAEAIKSMILEPMGLDQTYVPENANMPLPFASGYRFNDEGVLINATYRWDPSWASSAGSMISTVGDQLKWAGILADGTLISEKMREARLPTPSEIPGYGLGIVDLDDGGEGHENDLGHNGGYNLLYTAWVFRYHGYDVAILSNGQAPDGDGNSNADHLFWNIVGTLGW